MVQGHSLTAQQGQYQRLKERKKLVGSESTPSHPNLAEDAVDGESEDCKKNTYGPECSDKCGRCAGNQTCNTTTGNCPACLDGWSPPLCTEAVPEEPLLTPNEKVAVGVAVGAPLTWGFISTVIQVWQICGNAGWLPFLSMGGKQEEKEEGGEEGDESDEEEPPTKCSRFLKCIFCGGAGMCLLSFLFCISCGKVMSKKFIWRKDKDIQDAESNREQPSPPPEETRQDSLDSTPVYLEDVSVEGDPNSSGSAETKLSEPQPDNPEEQQAAVIKQPKTATFTEKYFATASWLENPHQDISQDKSKSYSAFSSTKLHGYYSSDSKVHIKQSDNKQDDDTNKSDQKVNDDGKGAAENVVSETGEAITEEIMLGQT
ncbi:uncharacterized protein [Littorina saxatilis]|uniref:uncharacterized protein n=1 Tax=Littorina saxatilis TaxID=31220 RepID=UPI0038B43155